MIFFKSDGAVAKKEKDDGEEKVAEGKSERGTGWRQKVKEQEEKS